MLMVEKICQLIEARGFKQYEVERLCGLAENRISRWKNGQGEPTAQQALRIADLLQVPVRYVIDDAMRELPAPSLSMEEEFMLRMLRGSGLTGEELVRAVMSYIKSASPQAQNAPSVQAGTPGQGSEIPRWLPHARQEQRHLLAQNEKKIKPKNGKPAEKPGKGRK